MKCFIETTKNLQAESREGFVKEMYSAVLLLIRRLHTRSRLVNGMKEIFKISSQLQVK